MTITQLEYVVAVATYRSFIGAADKCFVTQPTLSMQIQKLEDELGILLFDRSKHPIAITEIGEPIIEQAKAVLAAVEQVNELIQTRQNALSGTFRLGVIPTIAPYILPSLLSAYATAYPEMTIKAQEMETRHILTALRNGEINAGLVSTPLEDANIKEYPLFYEPFVGYFADGDPALKKRTISPQDIRLEDIWLLNEGHCMRNQILDLCSDQVEKLQGEKPYRYESGNVETLRKMVDVNGGLTVLPELATYEFPEDKQERLRYFAGAEPVREISLVTTKHFVRNSVLQSLMDEILKLVPEKIKVQKKNRKILRIQSGRV